MRSGLYIDEIVLQWPINLAEIINTRNFEDLKIGYNRPILYKLYLKKRKNWDVVNDLKLEPTIVR